MGENDMRRYTCAFVCFLHYAMNAKTREISEREYFSYGVLQRRQLAWMDATGQKTDNSEFRV